MGDLIAVPGRDGRWGCLQVTELKREGPGALTTLVVGVLDWHGDEAPTGDAVIGSNVREQGLTRTEIFTIGGYRITGNCEIGPHLRPSNFRDLKVGATHSVWGWQTAARRAGA